MSSRAEARLAGSGNAGALLAWSCALAISAGFLLYVIQWQYAFAYAGYLLALLFALALFATGGASLRGLSSNGAPMAAFFAYLALSITWSADRELALAHYLQNLIQPVAFVIFYAIGYNAAPRQANTFFVTYSLAGLCAALYVYVKQGEFEGEDFGSIRSTFGLIFVVSIPYLVWWIRERPALWKWGILALVMVTIVALRSRAALLAAPLALLTTHYFLAGRAGRRGLWALGCALVLVTVAALLLSNGERLRFGSDALSLDLSGVEEDLQIPTEYRVDISRRLMTYSVLEDIAEHPLLGTGYMGTLISTSAKYGLEISAHGLLAHFAETGLVGAALFFWAMYVFVKWTRPQPDASKYLIATRIAMAAILVVGLFHQVLESSLFYVVYALGCGYGFRIRQDLAEISAGPRAVPDDGRGAS